MGFSLAIRLLVNLGLYARAYMVSDHPFFSLASNLRTPDALDFHYRAIALGTQWSTVSFFKMFVGSSPTDHWALPLAAFYNLFGPRPWAMSIALCLCYFAIGFLVYSLARALGQPARRARWLALLISLWPPTLAWSAVPLRDGPFILAIFLFLSCLVWLNTPGRLGLAKTIACCLGLVVGGGMAFVLKRYMLWALPAVALSLFGVIFLRNLVARPKVGWLRLLLTPILLVAVLAVLNSLIYPALPKSSSPSMAARAPFRPPTEAKVSQSKQAQAAGARADLQTTGLTNSPPRPPSMWEQLCRKLDDAKDFMERARYLSLLEQHPAYKGTGLAPDGNKGQFGLTYQSWDEIMAQALKGFWGVLTFPPPWQHWPKKEGWSLLALLVSALSAFWYVLMPGVISGILLKTWRGNAAGVALLIWSIFLGMAMGWSMLNSGTIFRIRDIILLPMLTAFHPAIYVWLAGVLGLGPRKAKGMKLA